MLLLTFFWLGNKRSRSIVLKVDSHATADEFETFETLDLDLQNDLEQIDLNVEALEANTNDNEFELESDSFLDLAALDAMANTGIAAAASGEVEKTEQASSSSGSGFFGIEATGNKIVYVIDKSPSMVAGNYQRRFDRAVKEVLQSVNQLRPEQEFYVYLFCFQKEPMRMKGKKGFLAPTPENKAKLEAWLRSVDLEAGTDPRDSLVSALRLKPSCIFMLSDGEFNGIFFRNGRYGVSASTVTLAKKFNRNRCPIHTIGLEDKRNQADMMRIANESGGQYQFVPPQTEPPEM